MKHHHAIQALWLSFFSRSFYQDAGQNGRGVGFGYLFLLLAVLWVPNMIKLHRSVTRFVREDAPAVINQIPPITVSRGQVSADCPMPYFIKEPGTDKPVVIIDTTGGITSLDRSPAVVLLTRTKLIAKKREQETRVYDLSGLEEFSLDRERVQSWATAIAQWLAAGLYPFALIGSFIYRMVQALIYALIGLLFARGVNASLSYGALVRLSVFALTPVLILCTVNDLLPVPLHAGPSSAPNRELALLPVSLPLWWLICFIVAMGYLFFAVKSNAAAQASPPQ